MRPEHGLKRRISRTFMLQAAAISVAAIVGVYLAAAVIKQVLVTEALRLEADYFWQQYLLDPEFPLPDTRNLSGYLVGVDDRQQLPQALRQLGSGYHDIAGAADFTTVLVSEQQGQRLYLLFDGERVNELAAYFGVLPLIVVLLMLYLSVWLAYRASHRAVSPISWLAREVNRLDPDAPGSTTFDPQQLPADADGEIRVLAAALGGFAGRLAEFVARERSFTRDASHELRTPLTVIRAAADVLLERDDLDAPARANLDRIRRSALGMEELVAAFLMLAREPDDGCAAQALCVNALIEAELEQLEALIGNRPVEIRLEPACLLYVDAPPQALAALIGNLLRNAVAFTDAGHVLIEIRPQRLIIEDSGVGMDASQLQTAFKPFYRARPQRHEGFGVGLSIVERFSQRFGWPVSLDSEPGRGTRVTVDFPQARCSALPARSPVHGGD